MLNQIKVRLIDDQKQPDGSYWEELRWLKSGDVIEVIDMGYVNTYKYVNPKTNHESTPRKTRFEVVADVDDSFMQP